MAYTTYSYTQTTTTVCDLSRWLLLDNFILRNLSEIPGSIHCFVFFYLWFKILFSCFAESIYLILALQVQEHCVVLLSAMSVLCFVLWKWSNWNFLLFSVTLLVSPWGLDCLEMMVLPFEHISTTTQRSLIPPPHLLSLPCLFSASFSDNLIFKINNEPFIFLFVKFCGDILKLNSGSWGRHFYFCHWNISDRFLSSNKIQFSFTGSLCMIPSLLFCQFANIQKGGMHLSLSAK